MVKLDLIKGSAVIMILSFTGFVLSFFYKLFVARYLGPESFGMYSLVETIFSFIVMLSCFGLVNGITRYVPYYKSNKDWALLNGYLRFVRFWPLLISCILSVTVFVLAGRISDFFAFPDLFALLLRVMAVAIPARIIGVYTTNLLLAEGHVWHSKFSFNLLGKLVLLASILFVWLKSLSVAWLVGGFVLSFVLSAVYNLLACKFKISFSNGSLAFDRKDWLMFSLPLFFTGFFAFLINWSDNLIIGKVLSPDQLGIYSVAFSFALFLNFPQQAFGAVFRPLISSSLAKGDVLGIRKLFRKSWLLVVGLTFPAFAVMFFFSKQVLTFFYGVDFAAGYVPLMIVSLGVMIGLCFGLNADVLVANKKTGFIFVVNVGVAVLNVIANLVLIPIWGIVGAAVASAVSLFLREGVLFLKARQYLKA